MKVETNENDFVISIEYTDEDHGDTTRYVLSDHKGRLQWKYADGAFTRVSYPLSDAEKEERRENWIVQQIKRRYPINEEQRITRENITRLGAGEDTLQEFKDYHAYIEAVKTESHTRKTQQDWSDYSDAL